MTVLPDERVAVLDTGNGRIELFRPTDAGLEHDQVITLDSLSPYSENHRNVCGLLEVGWYLRQRDGDEVIRRYDPQGRKLDVFEEAPPLPPGDWGWTAQLIEASGSDGMLTCLPDRAQIVSAGRRTDLVRLFESNGSLVWSRAVSGIVPEGYQLGISDAIAFGYQQESDGSHLGMATARWSEDAILVQYRYWRGERREPDVTRIESLLLSLEDGEELGRSHTLPQILDLRDGLAYTAESTPFPRVVVMERASGRP
jgi:hypothetical protein